MGRLREFFVEYVGNLNTSPKEDPAPPAAPVDRRKNKYARELIDWIEKQMDSRGFPASKKQELVKDLRHAFRQERPTPDGVGVGVSDDAPS